jgi:hypothetical protein
VIGEIVHVVLLGGGSEGGPENPIGIAVYTDPEAAERRAAPKS